MNAAPSAALLTLSLAGIFGAGGAAGYFFGKGKGNPPSASISEVIGTAPGASAGEWADDAFQRLAHELELSPEQQHRVRPYLTEAAGRVFVERDRALLQMHLRLLEVHDALAGETALHDGQKKRLAQSRAKLKGSILARFAALLQSESGSLPDL